MYGERPLPFRMQVTVHAGSHAGTLEAGNAGAGAAMLIEGGKVPEHVKRFVAVAEPGGGFECLVERGQRAVFGSAE
jgi:hypothetical protein